MEILSWKIAITHNLVQRRVIAVAQNTDVVIAPANDRRIFLGIYPVLGTASSVGIAINEAATLTNGIRLGQGTTTTPNLEWSMLTSGKLCCQDFHAWNAGAIESVAVVEVIADACCIIDTDEDPYGNSLGEPSHM
jgi:hypothetical protein